LTADGHDEANASAPAQEFQMIVRRHFLFSCLLPGLAIAVSPFAAQAQTGVGAHFGGARDPQVCASRTAPPSGPITADLAAKYVTCVEEHASLTALYLIDNMKVQVGASRPFQIRSDSYSDIDPAQPVYPIRGSYVRYSCSVPNAAVGTVGKNCSIVDQPNATGVCFRTTFGDWNCEMKDLANTLTMLRDGIPPPH
jgi:hypothetical protein